MTHRVTILALLFFTLAVAPTARAAEPELWVYAPINFQVNASVDELITLLERSKKAGYNAAVITDFKFGRIDERPQYYYDNMARTRAAAERIGIELIPCVMPIGYSDSILINNPNLAEGIPARDVAYVVRDGKATPADASNLLPGGAFESAEKHRPAGWDWIDGFNTATSLDTSVKHGGMSSLKMMDFAKGNEAGNCRVVKNLTVKPWHQYVVSMWVKTDGVPNAADLRVAPLVDNRALNHANLGVKPTQDWTQHHIVFNSLDNTQVRLYIGLWGGTKGTIWVDDVVCRVAGGINMLRRPGCPIRVTSADGNTVYEEGRDFERWVNEATGNVPWPGNFHIMTPEPPITIKPGSRIKDGDTLAVSYFHTVTIYDQQVSCCLVEPELYTHLARQVELIDKHFAPKRWFMQHDELRVAGWCDLCHPDKSGKTTGQLLADNARRCVEIIRKQDPDGQVLVWSDMFDPHHNAVDNYYLVSSALAGSWEGLPKDVVIVNWNGGKAAQSLKFFADRGHTQVLAGYYDTDDVAGHTKRWMNAAATVDGVTGYMYATWRRNYKDLERFAEVVRGK